MSSFLRLAHRLLIVLLALTVLLLMIPVSMQIGSRFFEWIPRYMWTEEMSRFFFIWMVMLGATVGVREGLHFDVDIWNEPSPSVARFLRWANRLLVLAFAGVVLYWGIEFTQFGWNQTSELADLPMWMIFIAWPIAGFFWIAFLLEKMLLDSERDDQQGMHL
jgi:TRAP-type C4-dicarboxylate transport system permease small subunit